MNAPIITQSHTCESIFPTVDQIPEAFPIKTPLNQREYLIGGELRPWNGEVEEVISPIHIQTDQGLVTARIGHFPPLSQQQSLAALNAAVTAFVGIQLGWDTPKVKAWGQTHLVG